MRSAIRRKLNAYTEFVAAAHPGIFEPAELAKEILVILPFPEQNAILLDAIADAARSWIKSRVAKSKPEQMVFPDFPHLPPLIRVGRRKAIAFEHATFKQLDEYYEKLKSKIKAQQGQVQESIAEAKAELAEVRKLRQMMKAAARTKPDITVGELIERRKARAAKS